MLIAAVALSPIPRPACSPKRQVPTSASSIGSPSLACPIEKNALYTANPVPFCLPRAIGSIYADKSN